LPRAPKTNRLEIEETQQIPQEPSFHFGGLNLNEAFIEITQHVWVKLAPSTASMEQTRPNTEHHIGDKQEKFLVYSNKLRENANPTKNKNIKDHCSSRIAF
jgi:hypothetical protein